jgi:uncharacterized protein
MNFKRMADIVDSLTINFLEFIEVLKMSGARVSISEVIDAFYAMTFIDIMNKEMVRVAVSTCIAKSEEEKRIFDETFDRFFISSEIKTKQANEILYKHEEKKQEILKEASNLKFKGQEIEIKEEHKEAYANLSQDDKNNILEFLDKTSTGKNVKMEFMPVVEKIINSKLKSLKNKAIADYSTSRDVFSKLPSEAGLIAEQVVENLKRENDLLYKNFSELNEDNMPKVMQLINNFIEKYKRNSQRYKKTNKKKRLDLKTTIRSNLNTGSVLFKLKYKTKPRKKDKYLLFCDVSASMVRFSGFVFQFVLGMSSGNSLVKAFIFSEGISHINPDERRSTRSFEEQVTNSPIWRKGTDLSKSLDELQQNKKVFFDSSTILIIVSDAKTVEAPAAIEKLKDIKKKVKRILWFNPIPESDWPGIKDMEGFKKYCDIYDCSTLDKLQKTLGKIK